MVHAHRHHSHGAGLEKRNPDNNGVTVVYVTAPADFDGAIGGYVTGSQDNTSTQQANVGVGAAVRASKTSSAETTTIAAAKTQATQTEEAHTTSTKEQAQTTQEETTAKTTAQTTEKAVATEVTTTAATSQTTQNTATSIDENATNVPLTTFSTAPQQTTSSVTTPTLQNDSNAATGSSSSEKSSASPSATPISADSGALTGGAKAGIAIGVILGVGLIAGLIFFLVRRKKQSQKLEEAENEKVWGNHGSMPPGPPPPPPPMPIIAVPEPEPKTPAEPPQLNVRPMTEFAPDLTPSQSGTLASGAAGAGFDSATVSGALRNLTGNVSPPQTPQSTNSNPNPFKDPVNPFGSSSNLSITTKPENIELPAAQTNATPDESALESTAAGVAVAGVAGGLAAASASKPSEKALPDRPESAQSRSPSPHIPTAPSPVSVDSDDIAPAAPVVAAMRAAGPSPVPTNVHRVQMDFIPSMDDELELHVGQLIRLLHEYDDGWALCIRLDRSEQGVVPRSCLSARPVKPRARPPPGVGPGPRGPPMGPNGRMPPGPPGPRFYPQDGRPRSPAHPAYAGPPQPYSQRPMPPVQFPAAPRSFSPGPGQRPMPPRSMSPGPYGPPGMHRPDMPLANRRRSNSAGGALGHNPRFNGPAPMMPPPTGQLPAIPNSPSTGQIARKPVADNEA